jgi:hypothetical protein
MIRAGLTPMGSNPPHLARYARHVAPPSARLLLVSARWPAALAGHFRLPPSEERVRGSEATPREY